MTFVVLCNIAVELGHLRFFFFFFFFFHPFLERVLNVQKQMTLFLIAFAGILDFVVGACVEGGSGPSGTLVATTCSDAAGAALGL
jgi:hypothetical protein